MAHWSEPVEYTPSFLASLPAPGIHFDVGPTVFEHYPPTNPHEPIWATVEQAKGVNFFHPGQHVVVQLPKKKPIRHLRYFATSDAQRRACWVEVLGSNNEHEFHDKVIKEALIDSVPGRSARIEFDVEHMVHGDAFGKSYKYYKIQFLKPMEPKPHADPYNHGPVIGFWKVALDNESGAPKRSDCLEYTPSFLASLPAPGIHFDVGPTVFEHYPPTNPHEPLWATIEQAKGVNFFHPGQHVVVQLPKKKAISNFVFYASSDAQRRAIWVEVLGSNDEHEFHDKVIDEALIDSEPGRSARVEFPLEHVQYGSHAGHKYKYYKINAIRHCEPKPHADPFNHGPVIGFWKANYGKPNGGSSSDSSD